MMWALATLSIGILLSAFFSGSETGFYRVTRVRLVLDALSGNTLARWLLWLTNNPALFVATTLVGNNLANYIATIGIVLLAANYFGGGSYFVEVAAPILFSPLVFVYGELLPKNLFFHSPNRLLRLGGIPFLFFTAMFLPLSMLLWLLGRLLEIVVGQSPENVQATLARKELQQVIREGHEVGLLLPSQSNLAQRLFRVAGQSVMDFAIPAGRVSSVQLGSPTKDALHLARRNRVSSIAITEAESEKLTGYVRVIDLYLDQRQYVDSARPLLEIKQSETYSGALIQMQSTNESMAHVVDEEGETIGLLSASSLADPLFWAT